jgi:acyl carrier protein
MLQQVQKTIFKGKQVEDKLRIIFSESLNIKVSDVVDGLRYSEIPQWDSVAHMALIAAIEEGFDIMLDAEDVIDMSSFSKAKEIVTKYL